MWICSFIVQKAQALISSSLKRRHFKNWIEIVRNEAPRLQHASTKTRDMETPWKQDMAGWWDESKQKDLRVANDQ